MKAFKKRMESKDGKCPHCASTYVVKTSLFGSDRDSGDSEGKKETIFKCYTCNKEFYCILPE
jgi:hypothetical protein